MEETCIRTQWRCYKGVIAICQRFVVPSSILQHDPLLTPLSLTPSINTQVWLLLVNDSLFSGVLILAITTVSMMIGLGIFAYPRYQQGSITMSTMLMSCASLIATVFALLAWLMSWFFPGVDNSKGAMEISEEEGDGAGDDVTSSTSTSNNTYDHQAQLLLMCLAVPVLAYPNALFSWTLLFGSLESFSAALPHFNMFGPERLNWFLFLSALSFHWWISRIHSLYPTYYRLMEPITWLTELLGPDDDDDNHPHNMNHNYNQSAGGCDYYLFPHKTFVQLTISIACILLPSPPPPPPPPPPRTKITITITSPPPPPPPPLPTYRRSQLQRKWSTATRRRGQFKMHTRRWRAICCV